ncbi:MAG: CARDB domain-containing protein [Dehalococcoidales bacterium]|nr:CARDB domain-containing protein [Dehalococcoidales bacterium]
MIKKVLAVIVGMLLVSGLGYSGASGFTLNPPALAAPGRNTAGSDEITGVGQFQVSTSNPDFVIEAMTWSPLSPSKGDNVTFTVTVKNQGNAKSFSSLVSFYVDASFKEEQSVPGLEPGGQAVKTFTWTAQSGSHLFRVIVDEGNWIPEIDDYNNDMTVTVVTIPPDLIVQSITWSPESPVEGDNMTVTVTIMNQGSGKADYSSVAFFVDDDRLDFATISPIDPGGTVNQTFNWFAQAGTHSIKAVVDLYDRVIESDESNNEKMVTLPTLAPDLIIQSITWSPDEPVVGETVTFSITIKNQGKAGTGSSILELYVGNFYSESQDVQALAAGSSVTKTFAWSANTGSHAVKAAIDPQNRVVESDESNNEKTITFSDAPPPDLVIQGIAWSPPEPSPGEKMSLGVIIKNQGQGISSDFHVAYYVDDILVTLVPVRSLAYGATENRTFSWIVEAGTHFLRVVADANSVVAEDNETNNEATVIYPPPADLVVQGIARSPLNPSAGDNMTFTITVKNQGSLRADSVRLAYYIDDTYLALVSIGSLEPGAADNVTFGWTAEAGPHAVKAIVDSLDKIIEADEENNEKVLTFLVYLGVTPVQEHASEPASETAVQPRVAPPVQPVAADVPRRKTSAQLWIFLVPVVLLGGALVIFFKKTQ